MRDLSGELRRVSRPGHTRRVLAGNRARLHELQCGHGGAVHQPHHRKRTARTVRREDPVRNWRISREGTDVIALEPNRRWQNRFVGHGAFWSAVEYAAAELRKENDAD